MKISKKILSLMLAILLIVGMVPISAIAADTGETCTLTIKYAVEDANGTTIGTEIEDKVITGITPGTVIDLSDYWPDKMSVTGSNGETYYFLNHSEYSNNINSPLYRWVADKNDVIYAHYAGIGLIRHAPYELTFDPNGGAVNCQKILYLSFPFTDLSSEDQLVPVRNGYRFLGWSLDKNELSNQYDVVEQSGTLYAIWEELPSVQVGMTTLYDGEYTTDGQSTTTTKPESGGYAHFENGVLTLNNFTYTGNGSPKTDVIYAAEALAIKVVGTNTINATDGCAMNFREGYVIDGDGVLNLIGGLDCINGDAQYPSEIKNITLSATARRRVLSSGKFSIVNAKLNLTSEDVSSGIRGGTVVIKDSEIVSNATISATLGDLEVENSKIVVSGETALSVNDGLAVRLIGGNITISGNDEDRGAIYVENSTLSLPTADYWWRTSADGEFTKNGFVYDKQNYIELATTKPKNEWISTPTIRGWIYNTVKSAPQAEAKYGTVEYKYYDADKNLLTELPDNAGTYYLKGFVAETDSYTGLESDYVWFVVEKDEQIPPRPIGVGTTYIDTTDGKITGVDSTMEYRKDGETNYIAVTGTEITGLAPGTYYVRYAETANYNPSADKVITISLGGKRTPTIDTDPTASRVIIGGKLSDSTLIGGVASVPGEFAWKDGTEVLDSKGTVQKTVVFTPDDTATYNAVEFDVDVTVIICDTTSGEHEYTEQKTNADEHWTICAKCGEEESDSREVHKGGTATCTAKAKCEVCDTEYGEAAGHGETEIRNAKTASCNEEGYTGDKHCKVCGEKLEDGTAIDKTAHTYENGKCTVCGETDPNYVPEPPQTGDYGVMHLCIIMSVSALGITVITFGKKRKVF